MKKFFAVLLVVALMGFAGAAFAADAGHISGGVFKEVSAGDATKLGADVAVSAASADKYTPENPVGATTQKMGLAKVSGLTAGKKYAFGTSLKSLTELIASTIKLMDNKASTQVAAAECGKFYKSDFTEWDKQNVADVAYLVFTAVGTDAELYAEGTLTSDSPVSNKGSGGCNGGFAGLAALALGALVLRRKAR
ncbi:MAG: SYNERG-CTERM sorting domain-containing protein [Fretibacterium sp.]|nr:SYNERG-CTERM sorting domain-containing protein [Fretibacterium sp.]